MTVLNQDEAIESGAVQDAFKKIRAKTSNFISLKILSKARGNGMGATFVLLLHYLAGHKPTTKPNRVHTSSSFFSCAYKTSSDVTSLSL